MKSPVIGNRFPSLQENIQVYAVIAGFLYTWTILRLFWELPSWLKFLTVGELVPLFAYALSTDLLESLLVLAGLNLACFLLPRGWFRISFIPGSFLLVVFGLGYLIYFFSAFEKEAVHPSGLWLWSIAFYVLLIPFSLFAGRIAGVKNLAELISDRLIVFLYLIVPFSLLSVLFIAFRNIW